jgi:hypothetical protein
MARWLVHQNTWGVVSTASQHLGNGTAGPLPFGNAVSYSDGPRSRALPLCFPAAVCRLLYTHLCLVSLALAILYACRRSVARAAPRRAAGPPRSPSVAAALPALLSRRCHPTGRLLFYLTALDATAQDLSANPNASLTVCEAQMRHSCSKVDPQNPTCAKLTVSGGWVDGRGGSVRALVWQWSAALRLLPVLGARRNKV